MVSWYPPSNRESANVTNYIGRLILDEEDVFTTRHNAGSNETALSAHHVVPNCTNYDLQNVGWSLAAVNECGEGPRRNASLLLNPADNIGEDSCPAATDPSTSPSTSSAFKREFGCIYR